MPYDDPLRASAPLDVGLYVHVAFCRRICHYCDFNTYVGQDSLLPRYGAALRRELETLPPGVRASSLFFGGGTPSMLSHAQVADLVAAARELGNLPSSAEVTLEANPCDLTLEYLTGLRGAGVNRLSVGVQSFDDRLLRRLGRRHDALQALDSVALARAAGFENLSLDLMFALPGQDLDNWREALDVALRLGPEHLSLYCLTVEEGTPFAKWRREGKLVVPDDDAAADMYDLARDTLSRNGFAHYEISNFARRDPARDLRGQHNLTYWRNRPYFGLGAGAHSSFGGRRFANVLLPAEYLRRVEAGESPVGGSEEISPALAASETVILGLRLAEGVGQSEFQARFGKGLSDLYGPAIAELAALGLVELAEDALRLTARGQPLGNEVFERFLPSRQAASHG